MQNAALLLSQNHCHLPNANLNERLVTDTVSHTFKVGDVMLDSQRTGHTSTTSTHQLGRHMCIAAHHAQRQGPIPYSVQTESFMVAWNM
jgi:hypothetical protein